MGRSGYQKAHRYKKPCHAIDGGTSKGVGCSGHWLISHRAGIAAPWTDVYQDLYDANTTPTIYVLDNKKKIIGKKIPAEKLDDF